MKKVILLALVLVTVLGLGGLAACKGGGNEAKETWGDIPLYPGAKQAQKGSWEIPPEQGEWAEVEWRYYETDDSADDVAAFYQSQMPNQGWEEILWMEAEGIAWGYYSKNDEKDGAMFWCGSEEGRTFFALMRASQ